MDGYIKNNNYYRTLALYEEGLLKMNEQVGLDEYVAHRSIYALRTNKNNGSDRRHNELMVKNKYLFAFRAFDMCRKQYHKLAVKIGEIRDTHTNELSEFLLSVSAQGNHYLTIRSSKSAEETLQMYL